MLSGTQGPGRRLSLGVEEEDLCGDEVVGSEVVTFLKTFLRAHERRQVRQEPTLFPGMSVMMEPTVPAPLFIPCLRRLFSAFSLVQMCTRRAGSVDGAVNR